MGLNNLGLGFVFTARDLASAKIRGLESNFVNLDEKTKASSARISASFRQVAIGLGVFAAGAATVAGAFALAGAAGEFEQGLASVGAVTRATASEMNMLREAAIKAGIETQFSPAEAVQGLQSLATAGQTAAQATRTLVPVLDLAAGSLGQLGVAQAAEAVVGTLNAYGMAAEDAAGVTDKLLRITQLTNFQARDFEIGLSKAAATGATFNQSMDDVLITMGLLRNRNIDASSSATALREAIRRVGSDQRAQQAIQQTGVDVFDKATGRMRSVTDIMTEFAHATQGMTDAERNRRVVTAFGARGLLAFNSVLNASFTTMRDGVQVTLQGAEAIAAMRQEMGKTEGTAAAFREKLLDTFEGQKTLLRGTLQTLAIVIGEPFAQVFKPIVKAVTDALNFLIQAFQALPSGLKKALATFVVAAGAVLALVGAAIAAKGAIALLAVGLKMLGISIGGMVAAMLPAILVLGVAVAAITGFVIAVRRDIGGIGTFFRRAYDQIRLFVQAMGQLFEEGGFSGAVREELDRADNQGLKTFAIRVYQVAYRIKRFFAGIAEGFSAAIDAAGPVFESFVGALRRLGEAFGFVGSSLDSVAGLHSDEFAGAGARVGEVLARIATVMVQVLTAAVDLTTGIIEGFKSMSGFIGDAFGPIGAAFGDVGKEIKSLLVSMGLVSPEAQTMGSAVMGVGAAIGQVAGVIIGVVGMAITGLLRLVTIAVRLVRDVGESLGRLAAGLVQLFTDPVEGIKNVLGGLLGLFLSIGTAVLSLFGVTIDDTTAIVDGFGQALAELFTDTIPGWVMSGLAAVGQLFVDAWTGVTGLVQAAAGAIGDVFSGLWSFVAEGLAGTAALFGQVVSGIAGLFTSTGQAIVAFFVEAIPAAFGRIVAGIKAFFSPVVDFVKGIFQSVMAAVDQVIAFLGRLAARIPSHLRPAFLDQVIEAGQAATSRVAARESAGAAQLVAPAAATAIPLSSTAVVPSSLTAPTSVATLPAAAEASARAGADDRLIDAVTASSARTSEAADRASDRPINVRLEVDGDTLASATVKARREAAARSFAPMPAT